VREEYEALLRRSVSDGLRLVPVLVERVELPPFLGSRDYVDFSRAGGDPAAYRVAFDRLLRGLKGLRGPRPSGAARVDGLVVPSEGGWRPEGPAEAVLRVNRGEVVFAPVGGELVRQAAPVGVDHRLRAAVFELGLARRAATRPAQAVDRTAPAQTAGAAPARLPGRLADVGRLLGEQFTAGPVGVALAAAVVAAGRAGASLRLAVEVDEPTLADLPWETLTVAGVDGPLVLHPNVVLHRSVPGLGTGAVAGGVRPAAGAGRGRQPRAGTRAGAP
jgi:hypothetical protein